VLWFSVREEPPLPKQALARIKAAELEAGADLLNGLTAFWRGIGMSTKALREHDTVELMPLFERYAEKQFDTELLACFPDPEAYSLSLRGRRHRSRPSRPESGARAGKSKPSGELWHVCRFRGRDCGEWQFREGCMGNFGE